MKARINGKYEIDWSSVSKVESDYTFFYVERGTEMDKYLLEAVRDGSVVSISTFGDKWQVMVKTEMIEL